MMTLSGVAIALYFSRGSRYPRRSTEGATSFVEPRLGEFLDILSPKSDIAFAQPDESYLPFSYPVTQGFGMNAQECGGLLGGP
jgi:hypothetical protein